MRPLLTLLLTSATLLAGSVPPAGDVATRQNELAGTWALRYVEWMGERTDQEYEYGGPRVVEETEIRPVRRFRSTVQFGKDAKGQDRITRRGSLRGPHYDDEFGYRIDWNQYPAVLRTAGGAAVIVEVDGDVMRWCCRGQGDGRLPDRFASDRRDDSLYLLVFQRVN